MSADVFKFVVPEKGPANDNSLCPSLDELANRIIEAARGETLQWIAEHKQSVAELPEAEGLTRVHAITEAAMSMAASKFRVWIMMQPKS